MFTAADNKVIAHLDGLTVIKTGKFTLLLIIIFKI